MRVCFGFMISPVPRDASRRWRRITITSAGSRGRWRRSGSTRGRSRDGGGSSWDANTREPVEPICTWSELRELSSAGVSVQSHGAAHRTFSDLRDPEVVRELGESKDAIERNVGMAPSMLSYPYSDSGKD